MTGKYLNDLRRRKSRVSEEAAEKKIGERRAIEHEKERRADAVPKKKKPPHGSTVGLVKKEERDPRMCVAPHTQALPGSRYR